MLGLVAFLSVFLCIYFQKYFIEALKWLNEKTARLHTLLYNVSYVKAFLTLKFADFWLVIFVWMAVVGVDDSSIQADSQPNSQSQWLLGAVLHHQIGP